MLRKRLLILLGGFFLMASAAWADDVGFVDCSSHPDAVPVFAKARQTPDTVASVPCGERFTVLVYGFIFSRVQTRDGKIGYVYSSLISVDKSAASVQPISARVPVPATAATRPAAATPSVTASSATPAAAAPTATTNMPQATSAVAPSSPLPSAQPQPAATLPSAAQVLSATSPTAQAAPTASPAPAASAKDAAVTATQPSPITSSQPQPAPAPAPAAASTSASVADVQAAAPAVSLPTPTPAPPADPQPAAAQANSAQTVSTFPTPPAQPASSVAETTATPAPPQPETTEAVAPAVRSARARSSWEKPLPSARQTFMMEFFGGYSFARFVSGGTATNFNGGMGSAGWNMKRWLQIVADSSYSFVTVSGAKNVLYGNHFGPRLFYRKSNRWGITPFVEGLIGGSRLDVTVSGVGGYKTSQNIISYKVGGGVDFRASRHVEVRVIDFDYYRTSFGTNATQNNYWASAGIIVRLFGSPAE